MNKIYQNHKCFLLLSIITAAVNLTSCKKYVDIDLPIDQLTTTAVFTDSASAENAVVGLYSQQVKISNTANGFLYGNVSLFPALSADEVTRTSASAEYDQFQNNNILSNSTLNANNWNDAYNIIYQANLILGSLPKSNTLSPALVRRLTGEAKFFRAINYFYLSNEYGAVPLATGTDYRVNSMLSKSDTITVYNQIINDLKDAQALLPVVPSATRVRATSVVATALLARVYLYLRDYAGAVEQSSAILNPGTYGLSTLDNTFLYNSTETIFQFMAPSVNNSLFLTGEALVFLPTLSTTRPNYILSTQLLNAFEPGDQRKIKWLNTRVVAGISYIYPFKYKIRSLSAGTKTEYNIVFRSAEQYLIRAEALAEQNKLSAAITDLDKVRSRAGVLKIADTNPNISRPDLLTMIYHERQIEFFTEWGHRWFDLKRTGRINFVLGVVKGTAWQPTDALYPIPAGDILSAPNLVQNPGYN